MLLLSHGRPLRCHSSARGPKPTILSGNLLPLLALVLLLQPSVYATDRVWKNNSTTFNSSSSWNPSAIPGSSDVADFNATMVTQPNLSGSVTIQELFFSTTTASGYDLTSSNTGVKFTLTNTSTGTTSAIDA